jgi:DedD protein
METNLTARIIGAVATVLGLALILPNVLQNDKNSYLVSDIPPKPDEPSWLDESLNNRVRIELDGLAKGKMIAGMMTPEARFNKQDDASLPNITAERSSLDQAGAAVAWSLQIGAFKDSENAVKLRDKLRAHNFKGYLLKNSATGLDHVYVGPMLQRSKAIQTRALLEKDLLLKDIRLQQYKPE